jgi:outer membrane protein assembly factor BamB
VFTIENLFLASDDIVLAYNKKSRELIWRLSMGSRIKTMTIARGSLILILDNNKSVALKDDGKLVWEHELNPVQSLSGIRYPLELNNEADPRLDGSVILIAEEKGLSAIDGSRGTALSKIDFKARLQFISAYDRFENCIYAVVADEVVCIELNIRN